VLLYFEEETGFDPKRLVAIGYGRNYPIATNDDEQGRRKNRRVEIMILSNDFDLSEESDLFLYMSGQIDVDLFEDDQNSEDILIPNNNESEYEGEQVSSKPDLSANDGRDKTADGRIIHREVSPYEDNTSGEGE
jgi:chemotaxis protein MotB